MKKLFHIISALLVLITLSKSQWTDIILSPRPPALNSVYAYNTNTAYVSGDSAKVYYTSNGGINWLIRTSSLFSLQSVYSVHALSPAIALCICNLPAVGRIFKTTDAGITWFQVFQKSGVYLNDVEFYNSLSGYSYGNPYLSRWYIIKTTDGGNSWDTTLPRPMADSPSDAGFPNALTTIQFGQTGIWFGTTAMKIFYSLTGGLTWSSGSTTPSQPSFAITFLDLNTGFAGGMIGLKSTNSGANWVQQPFPVLGPVFSFINGGGKLWYCSGPNIYCSTNGGNSFFLQHVSPTGSTYKHLSVTFNAFNNPMSIITGWGVTSDGIISHYSETVGIQQIGSSIPESFKLGQNYPNPFNPTTKIRFEIPKGEQHIGPVQLIIYDVLGKEITTLVNRELQPGIYEADWVASNFPGGIYFYTMNAGSFNETRKMILVK